MTTYPAWMQCSSGAPLDLLHPTVEQINLHDIAIHLSRLNRFNGATRAGVEWSVAQHSVLVERLIPKTAGPELRLAALLHDAHEAYTGDITSPVAAALASLIHARTGLAQPSEIVDELKDRLQRVIHEKIGLPETLPVEWRDAIKLADMQALGIEKAQFLAPSQRSWGPFPAPPHGWDNFQLSPALNPLSARKMFLVRLRRLGVQL